MPTLDGTYDTGTASVANGSKIVTGQGTLWLTHIKSGDDFFGSIIDTVDSNTQFTLKCDWDRASRVTLPYVVRLSALSRNPAGVQAAEVTAIAAMLRTPGVIHPVPTGGTPDPAIGEDGNYAFSIGDLLIWLKAGGVWTGPTSIGAVINADYLVKTANSTLSAERAVTDNSAAGGAVWDWSVAGQVKAKLYASGANKVLRSTGANAWAEASWTTDGTNISGVGALTATGGLTAGSPTKATPGGAGIVLITSSDGANQLQGWMQLLCDATASNRRLAICCVEQGVTYRNVTLAEAGGNVGVGTAAPLSFSKLQVRVAADQNLCIRQNFRLGATGVGFQMLNDAGNANCSLEFCADASPLLFSGSPIHFQINGTPTGLLNSTGLGIGTSSPGSKLHVIDGVAITAAVTASSTQLRLERPGTVSVKYQAVADFALGSYGSSVNSQAQLDIKLSNGAVVTPDVTVMSLLGNGNVGIGTTGPSAVLHNITSTRHAHLGAGTVQSDASGNLTVSSDERLKDIDGYFTRSIEALRNIRPILYHWNARSGMDRLNQCAGFSAQNLQANIPESVGIDDQGFLTRSNDPLIAALLNAVNDLDARLTAAGF